jgi:hypothetical protein
VASLEKRTVYEPLLPVPFITRLYQKIISRIIWSMHDTRSRGISLLIHNRPSLHVQKKIGSISLI